MDIAAELEGKWDSDEERDRHEKEWIKFAFAIGRTFSNFIDVLSWPKYEVLRYLKARTRGLSIHPLDDFIRMQKHKNFACRVLRGDADRVAARLGGGRSVALRLESFVLHVLLEFGYLSQKRIPQLAATLRYADSESMIEGGALSRNIWSSILR